MALSIDVAGVGSRGIAVFLDTLIQIGILLGITLLLVATGLRGGAAGVIIFVVDFLLFWGYFIFFETVWNGQTPGKRSQGLRVVKIDGQPVQNTQVIIRNLVRIVDFLPGYYATGIATMLISKKFQRLGDLAAGTIVVRERAAPAPAVWSPGPPPAPDGAPGAMDTGGLREDHYALVRSFLQRRWTLEPAARATLAAEIVRSIGPRVAGSANWTGSNEQFLEQVAHAYRGRYAGGGS